MTSSDLRPNVVMELDDYSSTFELLTLEFKARVKIHNYEVKKLGEDIRALFNFASDKMFFKLIDM